MRLYNYIFGILIAIPFVTNCNTSIPTQEIRELVNPKPEIIPNNNKNEVQPSPPKNNEVEVPEITPPPLKKPEAKVTPPLSKPKPLQPTEPPKPITPPPVLNTETPPQGDTSAPQLVIPPKPIIPPPVLSVTEIRKQQAKLTMGEAIVEFNQLKTLAVALSRETLDNYVKALLYKNFEANGGQVACEMTKFEVSGTSIKIEESPGLWKKIVTDLEDKQALLNWMVDQRLDISYHMFQSETPGIPRINFLEQAVAWDDLEFVKSYFNGGTKFIDPNLNDKNSTPLAFVASVEMAKYLLDKGARPNMQVRGLTLKKVGPCSVLDYLKIVASPTIVEIVEAKK